MKITRVGMLVAVWILLVAQAWAQDKMPEASTATWCIHVNKAPNTVRAFGFDIVYPADILTFDKATKADLLKKGFSYFGANELKPGRIRVGGMEPGEHSIAQGAQGRLVTLTFIKKKEMAPVFKIIMVQDDMRTWSVSTGKNGQPADLALTECTQQTP
ncbi:MAG: cohesin domain-containing protein [Thermodesulfobacteriota bacterium]